MSPAVAGHTGQVPGEPVREPVARSGAPALARGVLVIRWAVLAWMAVVFAEAVVTGGQDGLPVAAAALASAAVWVAWLTVSGPPRSSRVLSADLLIASCLVAVGVRQPWFATVFPVTAALAWGAARGARGGIVAGGALGLVSVVAGLLPAGATTQTPLIPLLRDPVNFVLAGGGLGFVADLLDRAAAQVRAALAEQVRATERAARATERESLGRQIHDSVLQALALVHKHGRELAERGQVSGVEVGQLAELAAAQERTVRSMILRPPDDASSNHHVSLRDRLDQAIATIGGGLDASVTTVGDIRLPPRHVGEVGAAVEQALSNVVRHAAASHVWVFADLEDDDVVVSVRDDGHGFTFDEQALRIGGKFGLLHSIKGRAEDLGGALHVDTAPGRGTELELRIPLPTEVEQEDVTGD